ncbi:MAG: hypothetical protein J7K68_00940 [Candidatus Diapherotrites archaeon]|nr:hypothetical protein [Candidatus Diapherotrites archaeon]
MAVLEKIRKGMRKIGRRLSAGMHGIYEREARNLLYRVEMESEMELERHMSHDDIQKLERFFSENPYHPLKDSFAYFEASDFKERPKIVKRLKMLLDEINGKPPHLKFRTIERKGGPPAIIDPYQFRTIIKEMHLWKKPLEEQILTLVNLARSPNEFESPDVSKKSDEYTTIYASLPLIHDKGNRRHRVAMLSALLEAAEIEHKVVPSLSNIHPYIQIELPKEKISIDFGAGKHANIVIERNGKEHKWYLSGDKIEHFKKNIPVYDPELKTPKEELEELQYTEDFWDGLNGLLIKKALEKK